MGKNKKTVALVTILDNQNIGTYLQAYALCKVIERECGHEVFIVNYERKISQRLSTIKRIMSKENKSLIFRIISSVYRFFIPSIAKRKLKKFLRSNIRLTKKYCSFESLQKQHPKADIYLTGSDQVWNSNYNRGIDKAYYLDFAPDGKSRYAYAASIGMEKFSEDETPLIRKLLMKYNKLSVRENSAVQLLTQIGINNAEHVLDPTLLFTKDDWAKVAQKDSFRKTEPYLLIYSVEKNKKHIISEIAKHIAKEKKLRVYAITPEWFREGFECDRNFYFADPIRFLNLFLQADFTIVSSFHGTAFSVNLSKQFFSVSPDKFNSRIDSLLQIVNIPERQIIGNETDWKNKTNREIDFEQVQEIIFREREKSINFIKEHIH